MRCLTILLLDDLNLPNHPAKTCWRELVVPKVSLNFWYAIPILVTNGFAATVDLLLFVSIS